MAAAVAAAVEEGTAVGGGMEGLPEKTDVGMGQGPCSWQDPCSYSDWVQEAPSCPWDRAGRHSAAAA